MFLLLSTSDTDLLSARAANDLATGEGAAAIEWRYANPVKLDRLHLGVDEGDEAAQAASRRAHLAAQLDELLDGVDLVVVRLLGGRRAWEDGLDLLLAPEQTRPVVVLTGEQAPDAELMAASTVPVGVATQAHAYLAHGGAANVAQLGAFLSDTVLLTGHGFAAPQAAPAWGSLGCTGTCLARPAAERPLCGEPSCRAWSETDGAGQGDVASAADTRPVVAVLYYRAHHMSGNTAFVHALSDAIEAAGGRPMPLYVTSLREPDADLMATLRRADAVVTTVLAAGGTVPSAAQAGGSEDAWDAGALASLDVPIIQGLVLGSSRQEWLDSDDGVTPLDCATQVAVPEFDGRIISVPFSFKEIDADGLPHYVPDPERAARVAGIAVSYGRLRSTPPAERRLAIVLSAYPTKHARIGNAVGLDTPASAIRLLHRLAESGYDIGPLAGEGSLPGVESGDGDDLIHALIATGGYDQAWLTEEQLAHNPLRVPADLYETWYSRLEPELRELVEEAWGPAPGELYVDEHTAQRRGGKPGKSLIMAGVQAGNVVVMIQPPRGFGENPIAIYHDPDMAPSHHYLAAYRWLEAPVEEGGFGAHAVVHLGKHGNLEWLPGKSTAMAATCGPDAVLGNLPLIYPFLVNDPGEGTQAKRRAHATLVDHLVPPMTRADSYGDIAKLEQLLDEYAQVSVMDPGKAPAVRQQIWTLIQAARLDHDLGLTGERALDDKLDDTDFFDDFVLHVDGWLCEIKDVQIRGGLHVLGQAPTGEARVNLVLAMLQAAQIWGGEHALPGLREALGLDEGHKERQATDDVEAAARGLVEAMEAADWATDAVADVAARAHELVAAGVRGEAGVGASLDTDKVAAILTFAATEIVPRLAATTDEIDRLLHALDGGFVPPGPSGSPLRGLVNVLPTGRNFYSVDPRAIPSRLAYETGRALADSLVERYVADHGEPPANVGLSLWGTSAMRTAGDDIAEALALMGIRPVWDDASRRVKDLEVVPLAELGRPRVDVTLRISGFFRDAFPHATALLDDAVALAAAQDEAESDNYVRAHVEADKAAGVDERAARTRVFGSKPGTYGAGLLQLIDSRDWRTDADLAEVYSVWGGYAYGRDLDGVPARETMERTYKRIRVAAKNVDTREHDIADSDDYFQYHGGMVAAVRHLTGSDPEAYIGDSTRPELVATRTLLEETSRVFRARVVNPKWMEAMREHGYKGAFEMAATVDYLFGYDATTNVVADWMYERLTREYVLDPVNRDFLAQSNPWALHGMTERLLEAVDRKMWAEPDPEVLAELTQAYLDAEGDLEGDEEDEEPPPRRRRTDAAGEERR
ncbi:cobaltochelatase subunit CobN [Mobilicoccus pelagius]|uniref:Cobalamin biosynthesis protein n=1 Tax=Mobilicoccus pelagius NBRC 104925 TaxID=1089455 RepID=H5UUW5_9MICO|nr:cobaltochelatase subunit CobN [Mobilicoccus pelagius]GAB49523.1 cobalamin biosynthesis protein [Mobilicoccus pelagius NBRC 104925]